MTFAAWVNDQWSRHGDHPQLVGQALRENLSLPTSMDEMKQFLPLLVHVYGEHLFAFDEALFILDQLRVGAISRLGHKPSSHDVLSRARSMLTVGQGKPTDLSVFSVEDKVLIGAKACAIMAAKNVGDPKLEPLFRSTVTEGEAQLSETSPVHQTVAITANNLASQLEEKTTLTEAQRDLMIYAATVARIGWEKAGSWVEVERAEYRLSRSYFRAGQAAASALHAKQCLAICKQNEADGSELFFAWEALFWALALQKDRAQAEAAKTEMKTLLAAMSQDEKTFVTENMERVSKHPL